MAFQIPTIQAIIFGCDLTGSHIYEVNNNGVSCQDWTGFASIGGGAWHANSQMMFGDHVKYRDMAETMMLVFASKKRAEVAPGVGKITDMIVIGPELGRSVVVSSEILALLEDTFRTVQDEAKKVRENGNAKISGYIEEILRETTNADPAATAGELQANSESDSNDEAKEVSRREDVEQINNDEEDSAIRFSS